MAGSIPQPSRKCHWTLPLPRGTSTTTTTTSSPANPCRRRTALCMIWPRWLRQTSFLRRPLTGPGPDTAPSTSGSAGKPTPCHAASPQSRCLQPFVSLFQQPGPRLWLLKSWAMPGQCPSIWVPQMLDPQRPSPPNMPGTRTLSTTAQSKTVTLVHPWWPLWCPRSRALRDFTAGQRPRCRLPPVRQLQYQCWRGSRASGPGMECQERSRRLSGCCRTSTGHRTQHPSPRHLRAQHGPRDL
mmetsp:Transcript_45726/g.76905  ORF Transcript_45726/g.76905 Transcript_45726/m.76905 type:complete len:241 (+) Transcript_45726:833-1555(+)